ncbi:UNVERIFIED_CONTAM: hypothetical protein Sangu_2815600 [Sesamum angustifolium]|uniref:Uncharacterized protein n=1 Tax=Sesamum angustifolium TaxID=2727405 RepID=A0AAW2IQF5_9LAMI
MILQSYIIKPFESGTTVEKEEEGLGIERTHAKFSTYFVTMVPDENYLDAASRTNKRNTFFGERNPVPEDRATWLKRYLIGLLLDMGAGVSKSWIDVSAAMRVRETGFIKYSSIPEHVWLRFPDGRLITCYHMGMVRDMLLSSCSPDWGHAERFATDFGLKLNEDTAC